MKYFLLFLFLAFAGCAKEKSCEDCLPTGQETQAVIDYSGEPAVDGCDWNLISGTDIFHPDNLDAVYKQDQLEVVVSFTPTGDFFICGFGAKIPVVHITAIRER